MFLRMKRVPQFTCDEQLLPLHQTLFDRPGYPLTAFHLVAIVGSTVEESIAGFDGGVDRVGADWVRDFP